MSSYEFEVAAKNAIISLHQDLTIRDLSIVFMAYTLGNLKCTIYCSRLRNLYFEVTYNKASRELYVDTYEQVSNDVFSGENIVKTVHF